MIDIKYLATGLVGLSRAHRASTMTGHLGAALVAGYFFAEQYCDLNVDVYKGIERELNRIINGEEVAFNPRENAAITVGELFEPQPQEPSQPDQVEQIAQALSRNIDQTRQSGHNVIFAALSIRALIDHQEYATPSTVEGICKLIQGFDGQVPGNGYYGKERGRIYGDKVTLTPEDDFRAYADEREMAEVVLDELIQTASERRQGYGGLHHITNHAAALTDLSRYGFAELGRKGLAAHHQHVRLWRTVPNVEEELGPEVAAEEDPVTSAFWESPRVQADRARLTPRIKTL